MFEKNQPTFIGRCKWIPTPIPIKCLYIWSYFGLSKQWREFMELFFRQWSMLMDNFIWKMTSHRPFIETVTVTIFSQISWRMNKIFIDCITTIQHTRCDSFIQTEREERSARTISFSSLPIVGSTRILNWRRDYFSFFYAWKSKGTKKVFSEF